MLKPLEILEDKLAALLAFVRELQLSNRQLREQVQQLEQNKNQLEERMGIAQARIDQIIVQLQTPQQADTPQQSDATPEAP